MAQKIDRAKVHQKYNGHCGYCGKVITLKDMQVDHMKPKWSAHDDTIHDFSNLMPTCRRCNHYKRADNVEQFRISMKGLHKRLEKIYINNVAVDFGMIEINPFDGLFYFEKLQPMSQQTAVEQLVNYMKENYHLTEETLYEFEKAKKMEKEQQFHAFTKGYLSEFGSMDFEQYYTKTYGNNQTK